MLQNAYFLAKIGADTAENEQHFAEILPKTGSYPTGPPDLSGSWQPMPRALTDCIGRMRIASTVPASLSPLPAQSRFPR